MSPKINDFPEYDKMKLNYNIFLLLKAIKGLTYKFDRHKKKYHALHNAKKYFYKLYQSRESNNAQYLETFKNK